MASKKSDALKALSGPFATPEGRLMNGHLFTMDVYKPEKGKEGTPQYKAEVAFDPATVKGQGTPEQPTIEDRLFAYALEKWGDTKETEEAFLDGIEGKDGGIRVPFIDGNKLAKKREADDKPGDAYKGKIVIRFNTIYNHAGVENGPDGIQVFDEAVERVAPMHKDRVYNGCMGVVGYVIADYVTNEGDRALKLYLDSFQKTGDGERLTTPKNSSNLFTKRATAGAAGNAEPARRRRA